MKLAYTTEKLENSCPMDIFIKKYVDVPRFLECCKMCPNYNKKWSCASVKCPAAGKHALASGPRGYSKFESGFDCLGAAV